MSSTHTGEGYNGARHGAANEVLRQRYRGEMLILGRRRHGAPHIVITVTHFAVYILKI